MDKTKESMLKAAEASEAAKAAAAVDAEADAAAAAEAAAAALAAQQAKRQYAASDAGEPVEEESQAAPAVVKESLLRWRGILPDLVLQARLVAFAMLSISTVAVVFTQLGFLPFGEVRLLTLLVPISVAAMLFGPSYGAFTGLVGGTAAMVHALFLPFDYYEKFFATPMHSVVLFGLTGLLAGILFGLVERRFGKDLNVSIMMHSLVCLVISWFCSTFFQIGTYLIQVFMSFTIPEELISTILNIRGTAFQIMMDAFLIMAAVVGAKLFAEHRAARANQEPTLRQTFQTWLSMVFAVAFMIMAALTYTGLTIMLKETANTALDDHLTYVESQLSERERWLERLTEHGDLREDAYEQALHDSIATMADQLPLWETGMTVIAEDGKVLSASDEAFLGKEFEEVIGAGVQNGFTEDIYDSDKPIEYYLGEGTEIGFLKATQINYLRVQRSGRYQVAAILPGEEVFYERRVGMFLITAIFALLLGLVYALAMGLLDNVVVQGFDRTNETLSHITSGDLDQMVDVHTSSEFSSLSAGINTTVGALKDSIAAAAARIDRELSTAKAIQASALPSTFPPFPEIDRFDIFAQMNPAKEVGGDFYDFFLIDKTHLGFVLADVSGKGIPASLFMMSAKTEIESCMQAGMGLVEAISTANYRLCQGNDAGMFVTVFAGILDFTTGEMECLNAGHNPPLLRHEGKWEWLREKSGMFLGAFDELRFSSYKLNAAEGDELLLYTDGVTEAMNRAEQLYGEDRLEAFLADHADLHPRKLIEAIRRDLLRYADGAEQADDITMLSIEYGVPPENSASIVLPAKAEAFDEAIRFVHAELARRVCPVNIQNQIDVCMEELFINATKYAYADEVPEEDRRIRVAYIFRSEPSRITIEVSDEGIPFDLLKVLETGKLEDGTELNTDRGIFLTAQIADEMGYEYRDNCNVSSFTKKW